MNGRTVSPTPQCFERTWVHNNQDKSKNLLANQLTKLDWPTLRSSKTIWQLGSEVNLGKDVPRW